MTDCTDGSVMELTVLKLKDAETFNPMAILQLLKQMVATCTYAARSPFKAYQEREDFSKFYVLGGWPTLSAYEDFIKSDQHRKLSELLGTMLDINTSQVLEITAEKVLAQSSPILVVEHYGVKDSSSFQTAFDEMQRESSRDTSSPSMCGSFVHAQDVFVVFSGWQSFKEHASAMHEIQSLQEFRTRLSDLASWKKITHLELNQFI